MKTLQTIQTITKIGKIVSKVIFVCCIVGFCLCIAGIVSLALGTPAFKLGGVTVQSILQNEEGLSVGSLYAATICGAIVCVGEGILAKFAVHYFDRELKDGTPFNPNGAKELFRLGILSICIPVGTQILMQIVLAVLTKALTDVQPPETEMAGSVAIGGMLLILALVCRYGAELNAEKVLPTPTADTESAQTDSPDTDLQG